MLDFKLSIAKSKFFDRPAIDKAMNRMARKALSKIGAFVRRRAKSSIKNAPKIDAATGKAVRGRSKNKRTRPATSKPGKPPYSHTGLLKKFIFFVYEKRPDGDHGVLIGPIRLNGGDGSAPRLLEYGGSVTRTGKKGSRTLFYRARPFMRPALAAEMAAMPEMFKDTFN